MSDTDKTRPVWVQMLDPYNKGWLEEHHEHYKNPCDIEDSDPKWPWIGRKTRCSRRPSRQADREGIYPQRKRVKKYYVYKHTRHERAVWRELQGRILGGDILAAEKSPRGSYSHRHSAIWDAW